MIEDTGEYLKDVKSPTELKRVLEFEVPRQRVEQEVQDIIEGIRREISLPGFRKGKAPREMILARYAETAKKEAIERLIPEAYRKALEKQALRPVLPAEISGMEYGADGPLTFRIEIELRPEIRVRDYHGVKVAKKVREVTQEDIDGEIEGLRQRLAKFERLERESRPGDVVVVDYWRLGADEKPVRGSKVSNYPVELGSGGVVGDFNDALVGAAKGDRKTVDVHYPDDFPQEDMRGQTARFGLEVKEIGQRIVPEVDDEFVKSLNADSLDALRDSIKDSLAEAYRRESTEAMKRDVLKTIVEGSGFEVPEGLVSMGLDSMLRSYREEFERSGESGIDEKLTEMRTKLHPVAVNVVKEQFIVDEIAKREDLKVEDDEIEGVLRSIALRAGVSVEEARKRVSGSDRIDRWRRDLLREKVLDFLLGQADITE